LTNSYAILVYEIFHCKVPYADTGLSQTAIGRKVLAEGIRPTLEASCPPEIAVIVRKCWDADPAKRPTFTQVPTSFACA
jgi:hypothetical protein